MHRRRVGCRGSGGPEPNSSTNTRATRAPTLPGATRITGRRFSPHLQPYSSLTLGGFMITIVVHCCAATMLSRHLSLSMVPRSQCAWSKAELQKLIDGIPPWDKGKSGAMMLLRNVAKMMSTTVNHDRTVRAQPPCLCLCYCPHSTSGVVLGHARYGGVHPLPD